MRSPKDTERTSCEPLLESLLNAAADFRPVLSARSDAFPAAAAARLESVAGQQTLGVAFRNPQALGPEIPGHRLFEMRTPAVLIGEVAAVAGHDLICWNIGAKAAGRAILKSISAQVTVLDGARCVHVYQGSAMNCRGGDGAVHRRRDVCSDRGFHAFADLLAVHGNVLGGIDADAHLVPLYGKDGNADIVSDHDALADPPGENEHRPTLLYRWVPQPYAKSARRQYVLMRAASFAGGQAGGRARQAR
jgi:hypothetical protein